MLSPIGESSVKLLLSMLAMFCGMTQDHWFFYYWNDSYELKPLIVILACKICIKISEVLNFHLHVSPSMRVYLFISEKVAFLTDLFFYSHCSVTIKGNLLLKKWLRFSFHLKLLWEIRVSSMIQFIICKKYICKSLYKEFLVKLNFITCSWSIASSDVGM